MKVEMIPLADLRPLEDNPRKHSEKQITELVKSLEQFGQYRPLVVDEDGVVLAGNGLLTALQRAGHTEAAVYRATGLSPTQRKKLILADNKLGTLSYDDFAVINRMLADIGDFNIPGYDEDVLRGLLAGAEEQLEEAEQFGILSPEAVEKRQERGERLEQRMQQAAPEASTSGGEPLEQRACPTCGRSW